MKRILVVDDEDDILEALEQCLHLLRTPVEVEAARDGEEARERLREEPFDMVITDERMPGLRGTELLAWLRRARPGVVRVLMTAQAESEGVQRRLAEARAHLFVPKPFDLRRALRAIDEALRASAS